MDQQEADDCLGLSVSKTECQIVAPQMFTFACVSSQAI